MAPWTPANLTTPLKVAMDCRSVVWSGTNWSSLANAGSFGGSFTSTRGTPPVKGTVVNSITPVNFNGSQGLGLSSVVFNSTGRYCFFVIKFGSGRNTIYGRNWDVSSDSEVLYGRDNEAGPHYPRWFTAGFDSSYTQVDPGSPLMQISWAIPAAGGLSAQRLNGVDQTVYGSNGVPPAATRDLSIGDSGVTYGPEGLVGDAFYIAVSDVSPSAGEIEQMEGWASWTFVGDGSLLPVGHPYKSAAPTTGPTGVDGTLAVTEAKDTYNSMVTVRHIVTIGVTEAKDTTGIVGSVAGAAITGTLGVTEAKDTYNSMVTATHTATLAVTEAKDTTGVSGSVSWSAALAVTEAKDSTGINGVVQWNATLATTEAKDTAIINAATTHIATLAVTEAKDTTGINAAATHTATLAVTEAKDTAVINGTVTTIGEITGGLAVTDARDTTGIAAAVTGNVGTLAVTEAQDTTGTAATVRWNALLAVTEAKDSAIIVGSVPLPLSGALAVTEAKDTALINGSIVLTGLVGQLAASEARDTARIVSGAAPRSEVLRFGRTYYGRW